MRLLLLDTCGETGSLALVESGVVLRERSLPARSGSAQLVQAIREELDSLSWPLRSLDAVGVVNGPGSFTGVRVGLAAAKGLCEVAGLRLVSVSRLAVLLSTTAVAYSGIAVLDAGRGEFYVRGADGGEELLSQQQLSEQAGGRHLVIAEEKLLAPLGPLHPQLVKLSACRALALVQEKLQQDGEESVEFADANYVRNARALYAASGRAPVQAQP